MTTSLATVICTPCPETVYSSFTVLFSVMLSTSFQCTGTYSRNAALSSSAQFAIAFLLPCSRPRRFLYRSHDWITTVKIHDHQFCRYSQSLAAFQFSWHRPCQRPTYCIRLSCFQHLLPLHPLSQQTFSLLFAALLFSRGDFSPARRTRKTHSSDCHLPSLLVLQAMRLPPSSTTWRSA